MSAADLLAAVAARVPPLAGRSAATVLCYHRVVAGDPGGRFTVTEQALRDHLAVIAQTGRPIVPLADLERRSGPAVAITFDDNSPTHLAAAAILAGAGVTATFFVNAGELGSGDALDAAGVEALLGMGMAIGAHGYRHRRLVDLEDAELAADAAACREFLESLGQPLHWAYPGGDLGSFTAEQDRQLRQAGFAVRLTTLEGPYRPGRPERPRSRYVIRRDSSARYVAAAARGGLQLVTAAKRARAARPRRGRPA